MKQTADEKRFIPVQVERGRARQWQRCALSYRFLADLKNAQRRRIFLFASEGQGFKKSVSWQHNVIRQPAHCARPLPPREARNARQATGKGKRALAIVALRYAVRYGTVSAQTLQRVESAGIRVAPRYGAILPYAEYKRQVSQALGSGMRDKQS